MSSTFPRYLMVTPHDGLVAMALEEAAHAVENGGARLYGIVQVSELKWRPVTRQEEFDIHDRADSISGSK